MISGSRTTHLQHIISADNPCYQPSNRCLLSLMARSTSFGIQNDDFLRIAPFYPRVWASKAGFSIGVGPARFELAIFAMSRRRHNP